MTDTLARIKRAVLRGCYVFSDKALMEMESDCITEEDVVESILNAVAIHKTLRSRSPYRSNAREYLYVIQSTTWKVWPSIQKESSHRRREPTNSTS